MEINTFNEKFNELWNTHKENPENIEIKYQIQNLISLAKDKDSLVFLGENNPYEPLRIIPISFDGEKEYIILHNEKLLIYKDPSIGFIQGKIELNRSRAIVWPTTAVQWMLGGTDTQIEFVKKYSKDIGIENSFI
tara:strand:- start:219 stop:623 length:405 start_codon:yes stop_codon:yes gene_type:complete